MNKKIYLYLILSIIVFGFLSASSSLAQPYGVGTYNSILPYGNQTSLSISTDGNVSITVTPTLGGELSKASSTVTVSSTDIIGYKLYIRALSNTYLSNGSMQIPASENETPQPLDVNTWGYNIDSSDNFFGITNSDVLIKSTSGPALIGENTTVTYGLKVDMSKGAGGYSAGVVYTAVPQTY